MVSPSRALADLLRLFLPHPTVLQILTTFRTMLVDGAQITMSSSAWPSLPSFLYFMCFGRRVSDSLEPELETVVNWHRGAGKWTWVLWKSSQCSQPLSHLSSLLPCLLRTLTPDGFTFETTRVLPKGNFYPSAQETLTMLVTFFGCHDLKKECSWHLAGRRQDSC